jgi:hypothetical protein
VSSMWFPSLRFSHQIMYEPLLSSIAQ